MGAEKPLVALAVAHASVNGLFHAGVVGLNELTRRRAALGLVGTRQAAIRAKVALGHKGRGVGVHR